MRALRWRVAVDDEPHAVGAGAVLHVESRTVDSVDLWTAEASTDPAARRVVLIVGTGQQWPADAVHLGSSVTPGGSLVWHLLDVTNAGPLP